MIDIEMVVNLHVTERCNYRCTYCFGKWGLLQESSAETSAWADTDEACRIMSDLADKFRLDRGPDCLIRFNFVGGEPALLPNIGDLIEYARETLKARVSYVSNGLMLMHRKFDAEWTVRNIDIVGISVDSSLPQTNLKIGRKTRSGDAFDLGKVADRIEAVRKAAQDRNVAAPVIKVNTVVSELNVGEDFENVLTAIAPDRWKILKMLPVYSSKTAISDDDFREFAREQRKFVPDRPDFKGVIITTEDNDEMTGSYAMVDPLARFFWYDDIPENGYKYSAPMTEVSVEDAWDEVPWDQQKFNARYTQLMPSVDLTEPQVAAAAVSSPTAAPQPVAEPTASRKPVHA
ncbi:viperin family antiviral radical SAM protein [Nocardioides sp. NPDC127514]|uniref:viperin family antiviral radical SAM protein n=1 Tax=unclassified Nocardioides TaxID=2615069 RepID=UPI003330F316